MNKDTGSKSSGSQNKYTKKALAAQQPAPEKMDAEAYKRAYGAPRPASKTKHKRGLYPRYFVLKPHGNNPYAEASRAAMQAYANSIHCENRQLADELRDWVYNEQRSKQ